MYVDIGDIRGKVEWEGGLFEAAFGYGIHADSIDPEELPELHAAWRAMDEAYQHFAPAYQRVEQLLEAAEND